MNWRVWTPRLMDRLQALPRVARRRQRPAERRPEEDPRDRPRLRAARFGITPQAIDDTLYDAFGQRQVSTIFTQLNQYHVVLEVDPDFQTNPERPAKDLRELGRRIRRCRSARSAHFESSNTPLVISHQGQFPVVTLSFNLAPGVSLGEAVKVIHAAEQRDRLPGEHSGQFPGHRAGIPELAGQSSRC